MADLSPNTRYMKHLKFSSLFTLLAFLFVLSCQTDEAEETPIDIEDQTRNAGLVARYAVNGNQIDLIESGAAASGFYNQARQNEFWSFFSELIPPSARTVMTELELFADEEDGTAAYVMPVNETDLSRWHMGHNLDFVWDRQGNLIQDETAFTSIHEVPHLLTLDNTQVEVSNGGCDQFFTGEGCSNTNSYINAFYNQFWGDIYAENQAIGEEDWDGLTAFYQKYSSRFVSEYAAINAGEDIAESFSFFVMSDLPNGNSVSDRKVRFFSDYPELVTLRNQIRSNINFQINLEGIATARSERFSAQKGGRSVN